MVRIMTGYLVDIYLTNTNSDKDLCYEVIKTSTGVKNLQVYCWAKDEEHAKRIAYDTRTKILAEGAIPQKAINKLSELLKNKIQLK